MDQEKPDPLYLPITETVPENALDRKPSWRGWIHTGVMPIVIAGGIVLLALAHGVIPKLAAGVFFASSFLLFGNSALYHRFNWKPKMRIALKRIDHANIFLLIAGSYTPMAMMALPGDKGTVLLIAVWIGALIGVFFRVFWINAPRWLYVPLYVGLGWSSMFYISDFFSFNAFAMTLILVGGLCYTAGAVIYGIKKPNPFPGHFGFHEIFHSLTVIAFICHWFATLMVCMHPLQGSLGL
ncbi:MAG: hemolysin III family protein [Micrococcales bacterium]|nr:hemolysin III family protein [Actinomycetota bacterium]NCA07889.1 hemolysin III family protein [Micrococcales bacterium]